MRIAIDVREACRPHPAGKGAWTRGCVTALLAHREHTFVLLSDATVPAAWQQGGTEIVIFPAGWRWHVRCARFLRQQRPDAFLSPTSFIVPALVGQSVPCIPVVHDLIALRREPHVWRARLIERLFLPRALSSAARILCISDCTRHDLLQQFPHLRAQNVTTVSAGPSHESSLPNQPDGRTILHVGTLCPRKNQERLVRAYRALPDAVRQQYRLVLAGSRGWQDDEILRLVRETKGVNWRGYVDANAYDHLLSTCTVFAFPSLYEGFGLAVLDALQRGMPVLTSNRGSMPEVVGDAAFLVDPEDTNAIAKGLVRLLTDASLRERLRVQGPAQAARFSWKRTAMLVSDVLRSLE